MTFLVGSLTCSNPRCTCHQAAQRGRGLVHCPAHQDDKPSLSVSWQRGKPLLHCHGGCSQEAVIEALRAKGLWSTTSPDPPTSGTDNSKDPLAWWSEYCAVPLDFVKTLPLQASNTHLIFAFAPDAPVKKRRPGSRDYTWEPVGAATPPLWPLPVGDLPQTIFISEGESDCTVARYVGLEAFGITHGARKALTYEQAQALAKRGVKRVVLIPDADEPGRDGAKRLIEACQAVGLSVALIDLAEAGLVDPLRGEKDLRDSWIKARSWATPAEFRQYLEGSIQDVPDGATVRECNAEELRQRGGGDIEFLPLLGQRGYIPKGWSVLLAGYPKSGKTELVTRLCMEWQKESILYITEEPEEIWAARLNRINRPCGHITIMLAMGAEADTVLARISSGSESVVVVDTLRTMLGLQDEVDNSEIARRLTPLIATARAGGKTLLLLHHLRKGGGEYGEAITGGHAFLGVVDAALEISRDTQLADNQRRLRGWSRLFQISEGVYEMDAQGMMRFMGTKAEVQFAEVRERVLAALGEDWATRKEIRERMDDPRPSLEQVRQALAALVNSGLAERDPPEERRGVTHRFRLRV